ncbi:MAG: hypothetical protein HZC17_09940 [Candidatus Omnitrophica bacterium]|nr:hypothetical protein [Candidatus Omnitrophota bacterium]
MKQRLLSLLLSVLFVSTLTPVSFSMEEDNVIWQVKPREGNYMKYFGKRVIDVNRADSDRLVPQEFGWQGNQVIFIFHLTSKQLQSPQFEFVFEIISKDYDVDELVELDVYAGTNINNLKTIAQKIKIDHAGFYKINIPSTQFYLGSQNFVKIYGSNVRPIGYGENPPNCRFGSFKLVIPGENPKQEVAAPAPGGQQIVSPETPAPAPSETEQKK